jgi:hypothetical protein
MVYAFHENFLLLLAPMWIRVYLLAMRRFCVGSVERWRWFEAVKEAEPREGPC